MPSMSSPVPRPGRQAADLGQMAPELLRDLMLCHDPVQCCTTLASVLGRIAAACGAERVLVVELEGETWSCLSEWYQPGLPALRERLHQVPAAAFGDEIGRLLRHQTLEIGPRESLPDGALRRLLTGIGVDRILLLPFTVDDSLQGALALALPATQPSPGAESLRLLGLLSDGINSMISRQRTDRALEAARQAQARAMERLAATLSAMPHLVLEIGADGLCHQAHCARPDLLVAPPERVVGRSLEDTLPSAVAALQRRTMAEALRLGVAEAEPYALGEGDDQRWYHLTVARQGDGGEGAAGFVFLIRDITAERQASARSRLLARIVSDMPMMVLLIDRERRIHWANPAFAAHLGQHADALVGQQVRDFTDTGLTDAETLGWIDAALTQGQGFHGRVCRRIGGQVRWIEITLTPYHDPETGFDGALAIERDITDAIRAETESARLAAEAAEAHRRLESAIEALPDGLVMYDAQERLQLWNRRFVEINAPIAHLITRGRARAELLAAGRQTGFLSELPSDLSGLLVRNRQLGGSDVEHTRADGRVFRVLGRTTADGGHVVLCTEITDIRDAQRRLAEVIEGAQVATWDHDFASGIETVNEHWARMLGDAPGSIREIDRQTWFARVHPDDAGRIAARIDAIEQGLEDTLHAEFRLRHREGHWVHVITRGRVVARDGHGRPLRMSGVDLDVTGWRQAEERLQAILEASAIGTWQLDAATGRVIVDEAYARILGYSLAELQPISHGRFESLVHPEDLAGIYARIAAAARTGARRIDFEFRMRHRDGTWRWILSKTRIEAWGPNGLPLRESGVHLDVTEARAREAALARAHDELAAALAAHREAETRLADIAAVSDDWFWEHDEHGRFTYFSDGFERATGRPGGPLLGRTRAELGLTGAPTLGHGWDELATWIAQRRPIRGFVYRLWDRDNGTPVWIRLNGTPFHDADGRFAGYRGVGSNVTELILATEQAQAASRAKSAFLATMSHELRTPMTAVLGLTELLRDRIVEPEHRQMLDTIRDSGAGLLAVLDDILDLAKIEAGKLTVDPAPFRPAELARRCAALFRPRAEAAGLTLAVESWPGGEVARLGDGNRILQVLSNLLGNAIKFTERGGVRLRLAPDPDDDNLIALCVEDDGIGMSPEQLARVFDEFEQAESTTARRFGGTGLGLSITRRLVGLLGGRIGIDSHPGGGTRVRVTLPLPPATEPVPATPAPATDSGELRLDGLRVLVADDNATNRRILQAMLSGLGLRVTQVADGRAAVAAYRPGAFDLLLLDISMPVLDGPRALAEIRAIDAAAGLPPPPALAVTAHAMAHQIQEFLDAGFAGHVAKPFTRSTLAAALGRQVGATGRATAGQATGTARRSGATGAGTGD